MINFLSIKIDFLKRIMMGVCIYFYSRTVDAFCGVLTYAEQIFEIIL